VKWSNSKDKGNISHYQLLPYHKYSQYW